VRVLVTGTEGYLGCLLAPMLLDDGHDVVGLDTGYYKNGWLCHGRLTGSPNSAAPHTLERDVRDVTAQDLHGFDAVVHMAELSNDPIGYLIGDATFEVNHCASVQLAARAKQAGVSRFVYMSSCSVYGIADGTVDEDSPVNPLTPYAQCKALVERDVAALADDTFSPTFLRNATAFGASPRMRFDIVLNNLAGFAWTEHRIAMTSDGTPWRPLVHALDIAQAIRCVLQADRQTIHSLVVNVGSDENNVTVRDIAQIVAGEFPGCALTFGPPNADNRSYRVAFGKIHEALPGFKALWDVRAGAAQLHRVFASIAMDPDTFHGRGHTRLKQIEYLLKTGQVDERLFWTGA
jgi:nucleoside-diphosphate-sugar epimerase